MSLQSSETADGRIEVTSPYWTLSYHRVHGGVLDTVIFPYGTGRNALVAPFITSVDRYSDVGETAPRITMRGNDRRIEITTEGLLRDAVGETSGVAYHHVWNITERYVRVETTLDFPRDCDVSTVGVGDVAVRPDLIEFGVRPGAHADPDPRKVSHARFGRVAIQGRPVLSEHHAPLWIFCFHRFVEGFDLSPTSNLAAWEEGLVGQSGVGNYAIRGESAPERIVIERRPLSMATPLVVPAGSYTFGWYLGLPRIVERADRRLYHVSFGNHPWPSDEDVARWSEAGVNVVRLHNDFAADGVFWHDGDWPPYDEAGMAELRRVIATCHRYEIKVVPYFSIYEMHPEAPGYADNVGTWKRSNDQVGTEHHNYVRNGEFGVQMCPQSGWLERRKHDIALAYKELGFDGIYYDWVNNLPCNNANHDPREHHAIDEIIDLLQWTRDLVGHDGILILHLYGKRPNIVLENYADLVVNMEELSGRRDLLVRAEDIPVVTTLAESIPRSPCPSYSTVDPELKIRNLIAQLAVMGMFHWVGGTDPLVGITLDYFNLFSHYPLHEYQFRNCFSGIVLTGHPDVRGAVYYREDHALVVLANVGHRALGQVRWSFDPSAFGWAIHSLEVRDPITERLEKIASEEFQQNGRLVNLSPFDYRLIEVRPV